MTNALQVNFDSVLGISDNDEMLNMFKALESTGLHDFLGCPSVLYEQELEKFFDTTLVQDCDITCVVFGKYVAIPEDRFAGIFNLPTEGLTDLSEVPNSLVLQAITLFSKLSVPVQFSCKKRLMKYEFRLLNDILAKSITVKAGSFNAVTHERFLMMTAIHFGIKVNWSKILFEVLKEMVDRTTKRAKGFAAQFCVLLKSDPAVTLAEAKTYPPLKILYAEKVKTYVATNKTIDARGETDEPEVAKGTNGAAAPAVKKKRTTTGKAASKKRDLGLASVAPEAFPIQMIELISAVPAERPPTPKRNALKRKFRMPAETTAGIDDVDTIIEQILADKAQMETDAWETDVEGRVEKRSDETERMINVTADEFAALDFHVFTNEAERLVETGSDTEYEMETAMKEESEPLSKANLPKIAATDKGKKSLEEPDTVKGHPAREQFQLICGDIDFIILLREKVITEMTSFFHSFSLRNLKFDLFQPQSNGSCVKSPMNEETSANQIDFLADTLVDGETPVTQISLPAVDTTDVTESLSQLRASITRLSVNQLKTSSKIVALSLELLEFKRGVGAQNAVLISDVTDIHSQTKEIQALKTNFTDLQQKTKSGIAHGEISSHSPHPPPDDKSRRGGGGGRSKGDRSGYSSIRHSSSREPHRRDARYWLGEK
ncbi:hypothetical protein F511_41266 [Dorcoceras hygrometricum]|uniref:Dystroglycan-like n=1 Tax=Dorcoceras hygrometricum TaxID=472368 RepID=A0A2Z7CP60_9LAMI|nr:hypothetical protein F511_41266 [Dorcoceras hygrometricum]